MNFFDLLNSNIEVIKLIGAWLIYPLAIAYTSIKIAKFHFEKEMKSKYLLAKDKVANDILFSICTMLLAMWQMANLSWWISNKKMASADPEATKIKSDNMNIFNQAMSKSYMQLGQLGLYFGTKPVDLIATLQSEWNDMVNENNFDVFLNHWDEYRRKKLLPVLQKIHSDLKNTVIDDVRSFKLLV